MFSASQPLEMHGLPMLYECLNNIRVSTPEEIQIQVQNDLLQSRMPTEYLSSLNDKDLTTAYWCCLLAWNVTGGTQIPHEMQLCAALATYNGSDSLVNAGTGSRKTLPITLNLLLDDPLDNHISLTISPLKWLQVTQV